MNLFVSIWGFLLSNPALFVWLIFYFLEKAVKLSPWKWDDVLVDGLRWVFSKIPKLGRFLKKGAPDERNNTTTN